MSLTDNHLLFPVLLTYLFCYSHLSGHFKMVNLKVMMIGVGSLVAEGLSGGVIGPLPCSSRSLVLRAR